MESKFQLPFTIYLAYFPVESILKIIDFLFINDILSYILVHRVTYVLKVNNVLIA